MATSSMTEGDGMSGAVSRRSPHPLALAWFLVFATLLAAVVYVTLFGKAEDGEPVARLDLKPIAAPHHAAAKKAPVPQAQVPPQPGSDQIGAGPLPGTSSTLPTAPQAGTAATPQPSEPKEPPQLVPAKIVAPVYAGRALVADPALIEATPQGPLPRIASDGRAPMAAYAPAFAAAKGKPEIALVISGLGISAKATEAALKDLPPGVTLAFAPYAGDVQRWVSEARRLGHEVLLEIPMEPYDFPDSDPGPHTLRPTLDESGNLDRLRWSLTRITGYAGVTNLLGDRFMASDDALAPVMTFLTRRGLFFYDSGTNARSAAQGVAGATGAAYMKSALTIDTIQSGMEVDQKLSELETQARALGAAAGTGFLYPITIERIAAWAKGLSGRGFVLVPASAIVGKAK